jgi:tetratricopeptide (TPR) repeat protein
VTGSSLVDDARRVLRLVDSNPQGAAAQAARVVAAAQRAEDAAAAAIAGRAGGLAALHLSRVDTAVRHLQTAVASAQQTQSRSLAAEIKMSLAFALARRGESARALGTITEALCDLSGIAHARGLAQRGAIEQQLEQLDRALADYRTALPVLRSAQEWVWVQRIHCNRGHLYISRAQLAAAEAELIQAEQLCRSHGLHTQLTIVVENLAFLHVRRGDVPNALHFLDEAERRHAALGTRAGTVLLDRSELLLSVGLATEAREAAEGAVAELTRTRWRSAHPQAQLLLAEACLLEGDVSAARRAAAQAVVSFRRQRREEGAALARQLSVRCRLADTGRAGLPVATIARLATTLEATGWLLPALDTRLLAARVALQHGDLAQARALLQQPRSARRRGSVELRARAWHAEALVRLAEGRPQAALSALGAGVRLVEEHQATLGATDLRSSMSSHRCELVDLGLGLSLRAGRARGVLVWAERGRATALLTRPLRPPEDPILAQHLVELRGVVAELEQAQGEGRPTDALVRRQASLERTVRDRARRASGAGTRVLRPGVAELAAALGDLALVEYLEHEGCLFAVTVVAGRARLWSLGLAGSVLPLLDHVPFALRRLTRGNVPTRSRQAALQLLGDVGQRLDRALLEPMRREIGERALVVVPNGPLQGLPWSLLPSCAGRPVTVNPSAALWHRANSRPRHRGGVLVVAGPGLPAAEPEVLAVAKVYPRATLLRGADATVAAATAALPAAATAHFAAHGRFRSDNALFSDLRLADGPLTVYDLESLPRVPDLVVLAACDVARATVSLGNEILGLTAAFLTLGTATLIASLVPIVDAATVPLMVSLHRQLRAGRSPAAALAHIQRDAAVSGNVAEVAAAAGLICLGADRRPLAPVGTDRGPDGR